MVHNATQLRYLLAEVASDLKAIDRLDQAVAEALPETMEESPPKVVRAGLALYLHHFYQAAEQILTRINKAFQGDEPSGEQWHKTLLDLAAMEIEGIRPPVISDGLRSQLDCYRAFRHLVRHAYERELLWEAMKELVRDYAAVSAQFQKEIHAFLNVVRQIVEELESA